MICTVRQILAWSSNLQLRLNDDMVAMIPKKDIGRYLRLQAKKLRIDPADAPAIEKLVCNNVLSSEFTRKYHRYLPDGSIDPNKTVFTVAEQTFDEIGLTPDFALALATNADMFDLLDVQRLDYKTYRVKKAIENRDVDSALKTLMDVYGGIRTEGTWISAQKKKLLSSFSDIDFDEYGETLQARQDRYRDLAKETAQSRNLLQEMRVAAEDEGTLTPEEIEEIAAADGMLDSCISGYSSLVCKLGEVIDKVFDISRRPVSYDFADMFDFEAETFPKIPKLSAAEMVDLLDFTLLPVLLNGNPFANLPLDLFCCIEPPKETDPVESFISTKLDFVEEDLDVDRELEAQVSQVRESLASHMIARGGSSTLSAFASEADAEVQRQLVSRAVFFKLVMEPLSNANPLCTQGTDATWGCRLENSRTAVIAVDGEGAEFSDIALWTEPKEKGKKSAR